MSLKRFLSGTNDYTNFYVVPLVGGTNYRTLAAGVAEQFDVPTGAKVVVLTAVGYAAYCLGVIGSPPTAAAVPSGDVTNQTGGVPLPDGVPRMFRCDDVTTISAISPGACVVLAEFMS